MSLIPNIISNGFQNLYQLLSLDWRDVSEILFFATILYAWLRWLNTDRTSHLIWYFYGYCITLVTAHYARLTIVSQTLFIAAPIMVCICIILHQHALQKNFVGLKKIVTPSTGASHWIEELVRSSLYAMNSAHDLTWVIERNDHLSAALDASCIIYADLKKDLIELVMSAPSSHGVDKQETAVSEGSLFWVNSAGKLISYNAQWRQTVVTEERALLQNDWQSSAAEVSRMTDLIAIKSCASTRTFSMIAQGKLAERLSGHQTSLLLHRLITQHSSFHEGTEYVSQNQKNPTEQQYH